MMRQEGVDTEAKNDAFSGGFAEDPTRRAQKEWWRTLPICAWAFVKSVQPAWRQGNTLRAIELARHSAAPREMIGGDA